MAATTLEGPHCGAVNIILLQQEGNVKNNRPELIERAALLWSPYHAYFGILYGPWRIDKLGRAVEQPSRKDRKPKKQFRPGQIGAMVADYMDHDVYMSNTEKTKAEYKIYLDIFVEKFGETYWRTLAPGVVREWLLERAASGGPAGAHALYRTARAFFGRVRLCYDTVDHPGFVPKHENPLLSLDLELPKSTVLVWPRAAVEAFVALADETGEPSMAMRS